MLPCKRLCQTRAQLFLSLVATLMTTILNRYAQLHSQDVDCVQHYISQVFCPHSLTLTDTRQRLNARLYLRQGQDVAYGRLRYGAQVQIEPQPLDDFYLSADPPRGARADPYRAWTFFVHIAFGFHYQPHSGLQYGTQPGGR